MTTAAELYSLFQKHPVVCTDSRSVTQDCLFFALRGEHFDGNTFAEQALIQGAAYSIIDNASFNKNAKCILVDNVLTALQELSTHHRRQLNAKVLAITGTNGKTTTKELIHSILSKKYKTTSTKGNLNNHIGVPLTILSAPMDTEMLVVEMGANHLKEIKALCEIAEPAFGIITNVGKAHLEGFGSFEGVKEAKGELYQYLAGHDGIAFANCDNEYLGQMLSKNDLHKIIYYGGVSNKVCSCTGTLIKSFPFISVKWTTNSNAHQYTAETKLIGDYNFENVLAAICIANYFGVKESDIRDAIAGYTPSNNRSQVINKGSNIIILDAYNANPTSVTAALKNFVSMDSDGKEKVLMLGEMAELGNESAEEHAEIKKLIKELRIEKVFLVGKNFRPDLNGNQFLIFENVDQAAGHIKDLDLRNCFILIKGSRSVKMEKLLEIL